MQFRGTAQITPLTEEAIDLLAERLFTPLQIEHHLTLALEEAYLIGETPVSENVIESILAKDIDDLESKLTRHGYNVKTIAEAVNVQPKVIRSFPRKKLSPGQSQEIKFAVQKAILCQVSSFFLKT